MCDKPCDQCEYLGKQCDGTFEEHDQKRSCSTSCAHYDELNCCCWQAGDWGLCFSVSDGDDCHLQYMENDGN